jgi:hypothetical protein
VSAVESFEQKVKITASGPNSQIELFDFGIVAVGFGLDKSFDHIEATPYWHVDSLGQAILRPPKPRYFFVTGCGDGA